MSDALRALLAIPVGDGSDHRHAPYVRHVRAGWHRDEYRRLVAEAWEDSRWEVICTECGDTEGPADRQVPAVRRLRGPYRSRHKARRVATRHERAQGLPLKRTPASSALTA